MVVTPTARQPGRWSCPDLGSPDSPGSRAVLEGQRFPAGDKARIAANPDKAFPANCQNEPKPHQTRMMDQEQPGQNTLALCFNSRPDGIHTAAATIRNQVHVPQTNGSMRISRKNPRYLTLLRSFTLEPHHDSPEMNECHFRCRRHSVIGQRGSRKSRCIRPLRHCPGP